MKPVNISPLVKKYGPGYVAKSRKTGRVVAHAKKLDVLFKSVKSVKKRTDVTISWIPKSGARYVLGFEKSQLNTSETLPRYAYI